MPTQAFKRQAQQRLIGAAILVLVGLVVFPLVLDTKPRSVPVDLPIQITRSDGSVSSSAGGQPAVVTPPTVAQGEDAPGSAQQASARAAASASPASAPPAPPLKRAASNGTQGGNAGVTAQAVVSPAPSLGPAHGPPTHAQAVTRPPEAPASGIEQARILAALQSQPASSAGRRYVVQIGAYAQNARAHEVRVKAERSGLKTYVQAVDTSQGRRIRVRMGPFASQDEANDALVRLKRAGLPGTVMTL